MKQLDTIVLSRNKIEYVFLSKLPFLRKVSLSTNKLRVFPDLSAAASLKELRLHGNKITKVPDTVLCNTWSPSLSCACSAFTVS
eukprot:m.266642 g.266642  ORF g.266642 m.266642 type:complete len:84 (+) comp54703_c0_seq4:527-778(+)